MAWSNYRRLSDGVPDIRVHFVLVAPNDSGKSSIIRAAHMSPRDDGAPRGPTRML